MKHFSAALFLIAAAASSHAQNSPVGVWKTIDDDTKLEKSMVRISESGDVVSGRIDKLLDASQENAVCGKCSDSRKNQPLVGMSILEGMKHRGEVWDSGQILDPNNGKVYNARLKLIDQGRKLEVRGYMGPFFRTQIWVRAE